MLEIRTGVLIGLEIDGREYHLEEGGFQSLTMVSNKKMGVATCQIVFSDITGKIDTQVTLSDGVPLLIKIGRSINDYDTYTYRLYQFKRDPMNTTPQYTLIGYYDAPKWFVKTWRPTIEDTSSNAIVKLGTDSGLIVSADQTNDNQIWWSSNSRTCVFAKDIASRGYLNDKSAMQLGQTIGGEIRYRNLTTIKREGPVFVHGDSPKDSDFRVLDQRYINGSGFGNQSGGYNHTTRPQSVLKQTVQRATLDIKRLTQHMMLDKGVKAQVNSGRIDIGPVDCGNVHEQWESARYQNLRTAMMYNMGVELLIQQQTPVDFDLFDSFKYQAVDPPASGGVPQDNPQYSADYVVTAKAIHVEQGNYFEKLQGFTTGINADPDQKGSQV